MELMLEIKREIKEEFIERVDECDLVFVRDAIEVAKPKKKSRSKSITDFMRPNREPTKSKSKSMQNEKQSAGAKLNRHHGKEKCHQDGNIQCKMCPKMFNSRNPLACHIYRIHSGKYTKNFECEICNKTFFSWSKLAEHKYIHLKEKAFECAFCKKKFALMRGLQIHERVMHKNKFIKCKFCDKKFSSSAKIVAHMRSEYFDLLQNDKDKVVDALNTLFQGIRTYECFKCRYSTTNYQDLRNHMEQCQSNGNNECEKCSKTFKHKNSLWNHVYYYHSEEKPVECYFCKKSFVHKDFLKQHEQRKHKNKFIKCKFCDMKFSTSVKIIDHMRSKHFDLMQKEKKQVTSPQIDGFECSICTKKFSSEGNLSEHMSIHKMAESHAETSNEDTDMLEVEQSKDIEEVHHESSSKSIYEDLEEMETQQFKPTFVRKLLFEEEQIECGQGPEEFSSEADPVIHEQSLDRSINCGECNFKCKLNIELTHHMQKEHPKVVYISDEEENDEEVECICVSDSEAGEDMQTEC